MLADAYGEDEIKRNPATGLRLAPPRREEPDGEATLKAKALTPEELLTLLDELPGRWRLMFEFMAHTGLRVGEAIALRWQDIDRAGSSCRKAPLRRGFSPLRY